MKAAIAFQASARAQTAGWRLISAYPCVSRFISGSVFCRSGSRHATYVSGGLQELISTGRLQACPTQGAVARKLDKLALLSNQYESQLFAYRSAVERLKQHEAAQSEAADGQHSEQVPAAPSVPRGLYIYGPVGAGKSMLLDMFADLAPVSGKARYHFHDFMSRVHRELHAHNQHRLADTGRAWHISSDPNDDSVVAVGRKLAHEHWLLAFDEFQVTDVADALLMSRLFHAMWQEGTVLVATSNRPPSELYMNGLNRDLFLPFIDTLERRCRAVQLPATQDWRRALPRSMRTWVQLPQGCSPQDESTALDELLGAVGASSELQAEEVPLGGGRHIAVQAAATRGRGGKTPIVVSFQAACVDAVSPADMKRLLGRAEEVVLLGVPAIRTRDSDWARRFIHLVDQAYEARTPLKVVAHTSPGGVLDAFRGSHTTPAAAGAATAGQGGHSSTRDSGGPLDPAGVSHITEEAEAAALDEIGFAADRAMSRLHEMATPTFRQRTSPQCSAPGV